MSRYRKILDNPEYQELILKRIKEYGKELDCWRGICKKATYYNYKNSNLDFVDSVKRAKDEFRNLTWETDPELKEMAIKALRRGIEGHKQLWQRSRSANINGEWVEVERIVTRTQHNPSQWCVTAILGLDNKDKINQTTESAIEHVNRLTTPNPKDVAKLFEDAGDNA